MPLVGEWANTAFAFETDDERFFTYTWAIECPPTAALAKTCLTDSWDIPDHGIVGTAIARIRRRLPDNSDQTIEFPPVEGTGSIKAVFDPSLTHVTFAIYVSGAAGAALWTLGFWS